MDISRYGVQKRKHLKMAVLSIAEIRSVRNAFPVMITITEFSLSMNSKSEGEISLSPLVGAFEGIGNALKRAYKHNI